MNTEKILRYFDDCVDSLVSRVKSYTKAILWVEKHKDFLATIESCEVDLCGTERIDFNYPQDRKEVIAIIRHFGGKWDKTVATESMSYHRRGLVDGLQVVIYSAVLPPSCKVVETTEEVPACTRTIRRVVCK